jgi:heat shock protein HspQ
MQANETWQVNLIFYMQDQGDSAIDQNQENSIQSEIEILTIVENAATKFIHYVNENQLNEDLSDAADRLTITSFTKSPAIKDTAQLLTGFLVTLNILVPDDFDYCC